MELVRKAARVALSPQTLRNLSACIDAARCIQRAGWRNYRLLSTAATAGISSQTLELRLPPLQHPIHIRPGTSDVGEVMRSVIRRTYARYLNGHTRPLHHRCRCEHRRHHRSVPVGISTGQGGSD